MNVTCPGCSSEFSVDSNRIPPQGMQMRCPKCFKAIDVKVDGDVGSELEAELGIDLSGGGAEPPGGIPDPSGTESPPPEPAPAAEQADGDWPGLEDLSTKDLNVIGTYTKSGDDQGVSDTVWSGAGKPSTPPTPPSQPPSEPIADEVPDDFAFEPPPKQESTAEDRHFADEKTLPEAQAPAQEEVDVPAATPPVAGRPPTEAIEAESPFAGLDASAGESIELSDVALDDDPPATGESPVQPPPDDDAPDSIFAIEEASGVFSAADIIEEKEVEGHTKGLDDVNVEPFKTGDLDEQADFGDFQRETLTPVVDQGPQSPLAGEAPGQAPDGGAPGQAPAGGGPTLDDIDFASLLDDSPGDKQQEEDVFFVDSPSVPDTEFESPQGPDPFNMEEISFDNLDDLAGGLDAGGGEEADGVASDIFDIDMDASDMADSIPTLESAEAMLPRTDVAGEPAATPQGRPPPRKRKRSLGTVIAVVLLVGVVVLVGVGIAAWYMGYLDKFLGTTEPLPSAKVEKEKSAISFDTRLLPSPSEYEHRLQILFKEKEMKAEARTEIEEELLWQLAWFRFLFVDAFATSPFAKQEKLQEQYDRLKSTYAGQIFKLKLEAMELGSTGDWPGGNAKFGEYLTLKRKRMAELLEKEKMTTQVAREDNLLQAWFALENNEPEKALSDLKELTEGKSGDLYAALLDARSEAAMAGIHEEREDPAKAVNSRAAATKRLAGIVEQYPQHTGAKLMLGELLAEQGKLDQAIDLATDGLEKGKETKNLALQVRAYQDISAYLLKKDDKEELLKVLEEMKANLLEKKVDIPEPEDLLLLLCGLYVENGEMEKALGTLELCKTCATADYYLLLATAYRKRKLYETAMMKARTGNEKYPTDTRLLLILSNLSRETGQTNSAVAYLEKILNVKPDNVDAALALAKLFLELDDPGNARRVLLESERYGASSLELEEMLAQINEAMGDDAGTIAALTKILEMNGDTEVRKKLARYLVKQGNYQEAIVHFEELQKESLITADLRQDFARSLKATGRIQEAVDVLKQLLKEDPGDDATARFLADIYLQKEDFFNAKIFLEAARRADTRDAKVHFLLGTCCLKLQDDKCALESLQQAVTQAPEKLAYRVAYANLLFRLSRTSAGKIKQAQLLEARENFDYIVAKYENDVKIPKSAQNADIYFNRGTILFETGHFNDALRDLDKAMTLAPSRYDILVAYADNLYKMNRYDQAIKYYQEMLDSKVEVAHAYFYLGKIHLFRGQREKAKAFFLKCIGNEPKKFPDAHRHLGDIFKEKGLRKKARDHYKAYLELVGENVPAAEHVRSALRKL